MATIADFPQPSIYVSRSLSLSMHATDPIGLFPAGSDSVTPPYQLRCPAGCQLRRTERFFPALTSQDLTRLSERRSLCEELLLEILILVQLVLGNLPFGDGTEYFVRTAARPRKVSRFLPSPWLERKPASWMRVISL